MFVADFMVSDGTNFSEYVPSKADGIRDYNNPTGRTIKIGYASDSLLLNQDDAEKSLGLLAGYSKTGNHIKDVGLATVKQYLSIDNVNNTADSSKSVKYANSAGSASKCNNVIYTHQNEINFSGGKQATCYFNYRNADSDVSDGGTTGITYRFCNYTASTAYSTIEAAKFVGDLSGKATSAGTATKATTADSATTASTANRAIEVTDYNNTGQGIKIGYAGSGFTSSDFQYALGMNNERKIKDVSRDEYRKWLGLGSAAYTSSSNYAANDIIAVQSSQPTSSTCKLWIKI
nr:MAG TPA: hypothetical protein [Caudoviricetes sp.]